ncbi:MAG: molybdopterin-dependent oxidoreductase [Proteobacteria bacterium]|nr:molybdopterin-dependent oxidoreductase [Pseudomonadota bacterium]
MLLAARTPTVDFGAYDIPEDQVPVPPANAQVLPTACEYCIVGCGYKAYVWPVDERPGGAKADLNAYRANYPVQSATGKWASPNMHNIVRRNGKLHHVVVVPDGETAVNRAGNHSIRGGTLAQKVFNPTKPTADRLQSPLLRVRGMLQPISWDTATSIAAELSKHVIAKYGEASWAMRYYSYHFWENTYALTKLALGSIATPNAAEHDKPTAENDATGLDDSGVDGFSAAYKDWQEADVIYISGVDPYENQTILFTEWIAPGGAKIVFVNPRKSPTAAYAERNGGVHLQLLPGTDALLNNGIARIILENGWEDSTWIGKVVATAEDIKQEKSSWRRVRFGLSFAEYKAWLLGDNEYQLDNVARITGVPAAKIRWAAEMLAQPRGQIRPKASFLLEKGNYWSFNFPNSASLSALGLLCGAGGRPGQVMSRAGGHQRGMMKAAGYPLAKSPAVYHDFRPGDPSGGKIPLNTDEWVFQGKTRLTWALGTTWVTALSAGQSIRDKVSALTRRHAAQVTSFDKDQAIAELKQRTDNGGMVLIQQDIYQNDLTEYADLVLPAAGWGEEDFARAQGERRLRIYSKFYDAPGEAKPDWWIVAQVAKKMGFSGYDWKDSNEVFEEAVGKSKGGAYDATAVVEFAKKQGRRTHDLLREMSTTGIQLPARLEGDKLVGTDRLHDQTFPANRDASKIVKQFNTASGKAILMKGDWLTVKPVREKFAPKADEIWVINGRINELWQTMYDDLRKPFSKRRYPSNFLFINPADAKSRGIESGDLVSVENDFVVNILGEVTKGSLSLVAYVTDEVAAGVGYTYSFYPGQNSNTIVPAVTDPVTGVYNYKIGKGRVRKIGETPLKQVDGGMSFVPRSIG